MKLITYTTPRILLADEGKHFSDINDVYIPEHKDEKTGEMIPAHEPYYMTLCFPGIQIKTLEDALKLYIEEEIKK